ncbi:MAG: hypothetical protein WB973_05925 [Thermoanaerobaculia bacterium]
MKAKTLFKETDIRIAGSVALQNGFISAAEFGMLAESYREAAQAVVNTLAEDEVFTHSISLRQGIRAYPVFFLYRQALELTVKGIIVAGMDLVEFQGESIDVEALYQNHNREDASRLSARHGSDGLGVEPRHSGLHNDWRLPAVARGVR